MALNVVKPLPDISLNVPKMPKGSIKLNIVGMATLKSRLPPDIELDSCARTEDPVVDHPSGC